MARKAKPPRKVASRSRKITPHLIENMPQSKLLRRGGIDGRSRAGRFLAAARARLTEQCGGHPSPAQRDEIDRVARLLLHNTLIDERVAASGKPMSSYDQRSYLATSNSIARGKRALGLDPSRSARAKRLEPLDAVEFGRLLEAGEIS